MDTYLRDLFLREIAHQCRFASIGYNNLEHFLYHCMSDNNNDKIFFSLQSFLIASANISKILWPRNVSPYKERGEFLRNLLNINGSEPFKFTAPRNDLEHFDERLDNWYLKSELHNILDNSVGQDESFSGLDYMRYFNTQRFVFRFGDNEYEIKPIQEAIQQLLLNVEAKLKKPISN